LALQSSNPALQVPVQLPPEQAAVMLLLLQAWPQPPQCAAVVWMLVSQPSVSLFPLQSPHPESQVPLQVLPEHDGLAMWLLLQAWPQAPQWAGVMVMSVSQPSVRLSVLQSPQPAAHAPVQLPPAHVGVGMWLLLHTRPHPPQLAALVAGSVSQPSVSLFPLQSDHPVAQVPVQTPAAQVGVGTWLLEQFWPQPPQCAGVTVTSVSQPSLTWPLQFPQPASHAVMAQVPVEQLAVARGGAQATPQAPQFSMVASDVSHPLLGSPSQSA
jgi:hypothetical protein